MKIYYKLSLLFFLVFRFLSSSTQTIITNETNKLKKGIYASFDEFKFNSPSIPLDYEVVNVDNEFVYKLNIDEEKTKEYGPVWGFCDGKNAYINMEREVFSGRRVFKTKSQFNKILYIGRYCYFRTYLFNNNLKRYEYFPYAIDINTGKELCLNCDLNFWFLTQSQFKKIVSKNYGLWDEYKKDNSKEDLFLKYIKISSERNSDEITE